MDKMPTRISDIPKLELIIGIICIILLVAGVLYSYNLKDRLSENSGYTKGVIVDKRYPWKGLPYIIYSFEIDKVRYRGSNRYSYHLQEIKIGDTCYVKYERSDPTNNNLLRSEEDKRLWVIKKPDNQ